MGEFDALPENPSERKVIIALSQVDVDRLDMDDSRDLARRRDVSIVDADSAAFSTMDSQPLLRGKVCFVRGRLWSGVPIATTTTPRSLRRQKSSLETSSL